MTEAFVALPNAPLGAIHGFTNTTDLTTSGNGFNLSAGLIYRPSDVVRLGLSLTTPTWYRVSETLSRTQRTDLQIPFEVSGGSNGTFPEFDNSRDIDNNLYNRSLPQMLQNAGYGMSNFNGVSYITSVPTLSTYPLDSRYRLRTPLKVSGGLGIFFGKNGFISADAEFVNYTGMKLSGNASESDESFENGTYTRSIKDTYRNVVNLKLGGEYRLNRLSLRAGVSYYQDPYQQTTQFNNLDRSRYIFSGGLGYKTNGFYIDGTVLHGQQTTAYSPYVLSDASAYASARIKNQTTNAILTIGTYF
ncbi:hypothetical protein BWI96_08350 [Siphonobacter sp. SORGH_AS_0500]|uniref:hypothetical protein n=1 Tax=Siphonobacter sp. SORGH_AS_0500 TaxID=1864824 RepID=UPI000CAFF907|nr:hypothetical protein [Siphonobacter sp. SORGH_AS_0500]PKK36896.1 hypothetical protein BWI96_08350 [Siphonobacter sp. SORGH_AS_0500]